MTAVALAVALGILLALATLQVALCAGAPLGHLAWGGRHRRLPAGLRIASATVIVVYAAFGWLLIARAGGVSSPVRIGTWVLLGFLLLGAVPNALSPSRSERFVMTPVSLVLAAAVLVVALS